MSPIHAQFVGIGTSTPANLLTIKGSGQTVNAESPDSRVKVGFYVDNNVAYLQTHSNNDLLLSTNNGPAQVTLQKGTGNLGIGRTSPTARLDVNGSFRLTTGTEANGRVLTSDANGNANWSAASFTNSERFGFKIKGNASAATSLATLYNTSTSTAGLTASNTSTQQSAVFNLQVGRSGLYHFSFSVSSRDFSNFGNGSNLFVEIARIDVGSPTEIVRNYLPLYNGGNGWAGHYDKELEMVLPAGSTVRLSITIPFNAPNFWFLDSFVSGHLIAE